MSAIATVIRCLLTDLDPIGCACPQHRNVPDLFPPVQPRIRQEAISHA